MRRPLLIVATLVAALLVPALPARAAATPAPRVGAVPVHRCDLGTVRAALCGHVRVPLDYTDPRAPEITVGFGWLPASGTAAGTAAGTADGTPDGTIVAQEGGPGYPSTGTAADFETLFGPLLAHRNLLVVDARGTGRSTPLDCEPLQSLPTPSARFTAAVTACGRQLNHTWRLRGGGWVHASDLFSTANTARDLVRVLDALSLRRVDLYGDSYGTYFAQSFLARYPQRLRSVVLDSAYEARDLDPWYRTTVTTARTAFDAVCRRAIGCPAGSSWARIGRLTATLRAHPVTATAVGTDARTHRVRLDVTALVNLVNDAGYDTDPYRQLDAAARAYLGHDPTPLARLYLQDIGYDYSDYQAPADYYSDGLYLAVACTDYPQLFDLRSTPAQRRQQLDRSIAALPADTFAPFTTREWLRVLPYTETYTGCLTWPAPTHRPDPPVPAGVALDSAHVPVLILNGELDSLTPAAGGAHIARQMGPSAHAYVAANTVHLVALENDDPCGARVVRAFVTAPGARPDTSCLARIPAIRAVPTFPRTLAEVTPARGDATMRVRRLATVAVAAAGDAVHRYGYVDGRRDLGLRGGRVRYDADGDPTLRDVRFTLDTSASGVLHGTSGAITVGGVRFSVSWGSGPWATVRTGGHVLRVPAP